MIRRAKKLFAEYIVNRDKRCVACGNTEALQCSHFHNSWKNSVRWDPDNAVAMCPKCHGEHEGKKKTDFADLMLDRLGPERFDALNERAEKFVKEKEAARKFLEWIKEAA